MALRTTRRTREHRAVFADQSVSREVPGLLLDKLEDQGRRWHTLLDHSLILYGTNMGDSNQHLHYDVPHILVGGASGKLKGGRHLAFPTKTVTTGNLLLSILDLYGIHEDDRRQHGPALRSGLIATETMSMRGRNIISGWCRWCLDYAFRPLAPRLAPWPTRPCGATRPR